MIVPGAGGTSSLWSGGGGVLPKLILGSSSSILMLLISIVWRLLRGGVFGFLIQSLDFKDPAPGTQSPFICFRILAVAGFCVDFAVLVLRCALLLVVSASSVSISP